MIVIIFAMFIIISFLPLAEKQHREAINQAQVGHFAEHFFTYLKNQDAADIISSFNAQSYSDVQNITSNASEYDSLPSTGLTTADGWVNNGSTYLYANKNSKKGLFKILNYTTVNGTEVKDTEVELRVWRSSNIPLKSSTTSSTVDSTYFDNLDSYKSPADARKYPTITRVHLEFSWPLNAAYDKRQKEYLFYDLHSIQ